jgi:hypothetical protein
VYQGCYRKPAREFRDSGIIGVRHMDTKFTETGVITARERRRFPRYRCQGSAEIRAESSGAQQWGTITDISEGGCYIETPAPVAQGQVVNLRLSIGGAALSLSGNVVGVHPMFGMGVTFTSVSPEADAILQRILRTLAEGDSEQDTPASASRELPMPAPMAPQPPAPTLAPAPATPVPPARPQPMRLSPQAAVALLGQIAKHLAQNGVLTQQDFRAILEKNKSAK